jgi:hypothetical protein
MRLFFGALATVAIGWGIVLAAPRPARRTHAAKQAARRETAEEICKAQGPTCKLVTRPDTPRDLTGAGCVCTAAPVQP